jgi:hypothetical protein
MVYHSRVIRRDRNNIDTGLWDVRQVDIGYPSVHCVNTTSAVFHEWDGHFRYFWRQRLCNNKKKLYNT